MLKISRRISVKKLKQKDTVGGFCNIWINISVYSKQKTYSFIKSVRKIEFWKWQWTLRMCGSQNQFPFIWNDSIWKDRQQISELYIFQIRELEGIFSIINMFVKYLQYVAIEKQDKLLDLIVKCQILALPG